MIQSPFSNGGSPTGETVDGRYAFFPTPSGAGEGVVAQATDPVTAATAGLGQGVGAGECRNF